MKTSVEIIKEIRVDLGLSQHQLADILGVTRDVVAGWENDRARVPGDMLLRAQRLEKSAVALRKNTAESRG